MSREYIQLTVLGDPAAQKRHRHVKMGNFVRTYDPHATEKMDFLGAVQHHAPTTPFDGPLELSVTFFFLRPKSHFKSGKNSHILKDNAPEYHTSRKDIDNLVKFCTDAMNKIFYKDDGQICKLSAEKRYSDKPRTELTISEINESDECIYPISQEQRKSESDTSDPEKIDRLIKETEDKYQGFDPVKNARETVELTGTTKVDITKIFASPPKEDNELDQF